MRPSDAHEVRRPLHVLVPQREGAIGGADLHVLDLAAQQRTNGLRPVVWAPRAPKHYRTLLANAGIELFDLSINRLHALPRTPQALGVDLVHAHGYESNYLISVLRWLIPQWRSLPTVMTAHGWIETSPWLRLKSALDRLAARKADVRIASAHAHVHRLPSTFGHNAVVHNGVRRPCEDALSEGGALTRRLDEPIVIGSVGRLSSEKRIDLLLAAGAKLVAAGHDIRILVVGGGSERNRLQDLTETLHLRERVTFVGLVADPDLYYTQMDMLVQASDTEGTPRTVIEAMSRGIPVVGTNVGDVPALLDHGRCGMLVDPDDSSAIAAAVQALISDRQFARKLGRRARQRFDQLFTIAAMERGVADCYKAALASRSVSTEEVAHGNSAR